MAGKASGRAKTHAAGKHRNGAGSPAQKPGAKPKAGTAAKGASASKRSHVKGGFAGGGRSWEKAGKPAQDRFGKGGHRAAPMSADPCGASRRCGACQHIAEPYNQQLERKLAYVRRLYVSAGVVQPGVLCELSAAFSPSGLSDGTAAADMAAAGAAGAVAFSPVLGMADPRFYRNKVISPFARGKRLADGKHGARYAIECGMYAAHSHKIIDTSGCLIENRQAKQVISEIKRLMGKFGIEPYDEDTGEGFMRHAVVRVGHESGEVLVTLVTNASAFPASRAFCRELARRCPFVTSVVQNVNTRQTNVILGEEEHRLYGPGFILDTLCGLSFRISSHSFYQVNSTQTEVLYNTAIALAGLNGAQDVIDAYCGTGTIGLVAASRGARSVVGVDTVESAIRDARENARHNGIENARFVVGDAGAFMRELADQADRAAAPLVVFMDPPRAGSTEEFLDALAKLAPDRVVYISCNAETQVRDIAYLQRFGYRARMVVPVDMFPHTDHIEVVTLLEKPQG